VAVVVTAAVVWYVSRPTQNMTVASAFTPTKANLAPPPGPAPEGMVWVPGGEFSMGSVDPRATLYGGPE
jgi:sulfatase modifying factor 1